MSFELPSPFLSNYFINLNGKNEILLTNTESCKNGLILSEKDAKMLVQEGRDAVAVQDRIEFGKSATIKIIEKFMQSTYISQAEYADTLAALIHVFYEAKEESLDILNDDEVIDIMYDFFEHESGGSIDILQERDMDCLCRKIRNKASGLDEGENEDYDE